MNVKVISDLPKKRSWPGITLGTNRGQELGIYGEEGDMRKKYLITLIV